jgi:hypothetical protein
MIDWLRLQASETKSKATKQAKEMMTRDEVAVRLRAVEGKRVRIVFADGVTQDVDISSVDDEGFLHSGPDGVNPAWF